MKLIESSIRFPVTVLVGVLLAVIFGVVALTRIPMQMAPTVDRPQITVETIWPGAAPREIEEEITDKLEEKLNSVEGLTEIVSTSEEGKSTIALKFDWGTNKDLARLDVSEKVGLVGDLPEEANEPVIQAVNSDEESPFSWIVIQTDLPINDVRIVAEDVMKPRFERIEGVGTVWMFGGEEKEVHVLVDPLALAARGIPLTRLRDALRRENRNVKAGTLEEGKARYVVRTIGQFESLSEVEATVVGFEDGKPVHLREVARVEFGWADRMVTVRQMGEPSIAFGILRKTGANTVEVMKEVRRVVGWLNDQYSDKGIALDIAYDETDYIDEAVGLVGNNLLYGAALAVVVLLIFLRSGISTFIVAFSIPISIVVTFIFLQVLDRSLNIISLAGLAFAVGMVVDNAIVVIENIFRHQQMGKDPFRAAFDGTREVWGAILSSTLTTLAVFVPILGIEQEAGQLFRDIAIALSCAIGMSLLVSITVIPMLCSRLLKVKERRPFESAARGGTMAVSGIVGIVSWLLGGSLRKAGAALGIVALAVVLAILFRPPMDYLPQGNRPMILTILDTPPGYNIDHMEEIVGTLERRVLPIPELDRMFAVAMPDNPILGAIIKDEHSDKESMQRLTNEIRGKGFGIPGVVYPIVFQVPLFSSGGGFLSGDLEVTIKGPDLGVIEGLAGRIQGASWGIASEAGFTSVLSSFEPGLPEVQIRVDREKAAALGLTVSDIGYVVGTVVDGTLAGEYREKGREIDMVLLGDETHRARTQDVLRTPLVTPTGDQVNLGDVADLVTTSGPAKIEHTDLDRSVKIAIRVDPTMPLDQARQILERAVVTPVRASLPGLEYTVELRGKARDLDLTWIAVRGSFLLAVIIVYLLMSALFESFASPLVIMLSVPMALTGGIFGLAAARAFDTTVKMDVITMLGFVILSGIVVNNAILIVHQTLNNVRVGSDFREALIESVRSRVRPIFMSTTTSIMGMIPLVISSGAGTELYRGLGAVVVGGLAISTVFTLFLIPCLFSLALDLRGWFTTAFGWKSLEESLREAGSFRAGEE